MQRYMLLDRDGNVAAEVKNFPVGSSVIRWRGTNYIYSPYHRNGDVTDKDGEILDAVD